MPKRKRANFKKFSLKRVCPDTEKALETEKPEDEETEEETEDKIEDETEDEETEDEAEEVLNDRRVRGREAEEVSNDRRMRGQRRMSGREGEEVSDEESEGGINSKEDKSVKERSFVWSHFEKIMDDKNVIWAKCKYCR